MLVPDKVWTIRGGPHTNCDLRIILLNLSFFNMSFRIVVFTTGWCVLSMANSWRVHRLRLFYLNRFSNRFRNVPIDTKYVEDMFRLKCLPQNRHVFNFRCGSAMLKSLYDFSSLGRCDRCDTTFLEETNVK